MAGLFYRLFQMPGMGHCARAYDLNWIKTLENWVEKSDTPEKVIGKRLPPPRFPPAPPTTSSHDLGARPICAYPDVTHYTRKGSADDPANFSCVPHKRGARPADRQ